MRLIESICIENGQPQRLALHQERVDRAFSHFFPEEPPFLLRLLFEGRPLPPEGRHKLRMLYSRMGLAGWAVEPYTPREHRRIGLVEAPGFLYPHKAEDRRFFHSLFRLHPGFDDFIILHNGMLTDSTYCNLALFDGERWLTPADCLLPGTRRREYLEQGLLAEARMEHSLLFSQQKLAFINAMRGLETATPVADVEFEIL